MIPDLNSDVQNDRGMNEDRDMKDDIATVGILGQSHILTARILQRILQSDDLQLTELFPARNRFNEEDHRVSSPREIARPEIGATCYYQYEEDGIRLTLCVQMSEDECGKDHSLVWNENVEQKIERIARRFIPTWNYDENTKWRALEMLEVRIFEQGVLTDGIHVFYNPLMQGGAILRLRFKLFAPI